MAAERALALDANLAEAHAVKARIRNTSRIAMTKAAAEIDIALRLDQESYESQPGQPASLSFGEEANWTMPFAITKKP